jgi:hypothetical protein
MTAQARTATDAPQVFHDVAEQSAAQARKNLETMVAAAGEAINLLKHNYATALICTQDYGGKVLEFTNANISAAVEQATKLMSVKSQMEFFTLSNDYAERQFEIFTRQAQGTRRNRPENDHCDEQKPLRHKGSVSNRLEPGSPGLRFGIWSSMCGGDWVREDVRSRSLSRSLCARPRLAILHRPGA